MPSARPRDNPPVLIKTTTTLDGAVEVADAQVIAIAQEVSPNNLESVGKGKGLVIVDGSAPISVLAQGGANVSGTSTAVVAASTARAKLDVMNAGEARVWLGIDQPAQIDVGLFLEPGFAFTEYTRAAVNALTEDGTTVRVTFVEWA